MKKRKMIIAAVIILALLCMFFVVRGIIKDRNELSKAEYYAKELTEKYNPNIMVVGEDIDVEKYLNCRHLEKVTEETLLDGKEFGYNCIILSDLNGKLKISDDELLLIKKYCEEKGYDMIYVGTSYLDTFVRLGFSYGYESYDKSLAYEGSLRYAKYSSSVDKPEYGCYASFGLWTTECEEHNLNVSEEILFFMEYYANKSNSLRIKND